MTPETLDEVWAAVEAAMPDGWYGPHLYGTRHLTVTHGVPYKAEAFRPNPGRSDDPSLFGRGSTPVEAMLSLLDLLKELP